MAIVREEALAERLLCRFIVVSFHFLFQLALTSNIGGHLLE